MSISQIREPGVGSGKWDRRYKEKQQARERQKRYKQRKKDNEAFDNERTALLLIEPAEFRPFQDYANGQEALATSRLFAYALNVLDVQESETIGAFALRVEQEWYRGMQDGGIAKFLSLKTGKLHNEMGFRRDEKDFVDWTHWTVEVWSDFPGGTDTVNVAELPELETYLVPDSVNPWVEAGLTYKEWADDQKRKAAYEEFMARPVEPDKPAPPQDPFVTVQTAAGGSIRIPRDVYEAAQRGSK